MPAFFPSLVVNFELRFDEALTVSDNPEPRSIDDTTQSPPLNLAATPGEPLVLQRGDENVSWVFGRVPKRCTIDLNSYRQASTFQMTVDFRELPIDPRTIRAAAVEIHLGTVSGEDFARGMDNQTTAAVYRRRLSTLRTRDESGRPRAETLLFRGLVDDWNVEHSGTGSEISIKGRDMRSLLIDSPLMSRTQNAEQVLAALDMNQNIVNVVRQIMSFHPMAEQYRMQVNAAEWPGGVIPQCLPASAVPRHRRGARGRRAGGRASAPGSSTQTTFWDLIVQCCYLVGAIPYFSGTDLLIRPAASIFDQRRAAFDPRRRTPFAGGRPRTIAGAPFAVRRLFYGRDIERVAFERKFGGNGRPKVVRVVATDASSTQRGVSTVLEARWPEATAPVNARSTRAAPGGQTAQEEIQTFPVRGVRDVQTLQRIAQNLFEELGRNEMGGTCQTKNLASFGGDNEDPDVLRLKPGDAVEFFTDTRPLRDQAPLVSTLTSFNRESFTEAVSQLAARIGDRNLARVIVATARGSVAQLQTFFRVATVKYDWATSDTGGGVDVSFDFQNYFVPRQVAPDVPDAPGAVQSATVPRAGVR